LLADVVSYLKVTIEVEEDEFPYFMGMLRFLFGVPVENFSSVKDVLSILNQADKVSFI